MRQALGLASLQAQVDELKARTEAQAEALLQVRAASLAQRRVLSDTLRASSSSSPSAADGPAALKEPLPLAAALSQLEALAPAAYAHWRPRLDVNEEAYHGLPTHSCSVKGHPMATLFSDFVYPYLGGRVLDIGCGPQPVPLYVASHPLERLSGTDPISDPAAHPFQFVSGVAELLPWQDGQFQAVIASTSLDHVLLLDRTFDEVKRVLAPGGHFVVWVSFTPGAPAYDPYVNHLTPIDRFHLFHFDQPWFEAMVARWFCTVERVVLDWPHQSAFYSFRVKDEVGSR